MDLKIRDANIEPDTLCLKINYCSNCAHKNEFELGTSMELNTCPHPYTKQEKVLVFLNHTDRSNTISTPST